MPGLARRVPSLVNPTWSLSPELPATACELGAGLGAWCLAGGPPDWQTPVEPILVVLEKPCKAASLEASMEDQKFSHYEARASCLEQTLARSQLFLAMRQRPQVQVGRTVAPVPVPGRGLKVRQGGLQNAFLVFIV